MSLSVYFTIHILSRSGKEGSSPWRMTISMECHITDFLKFSELKYECEYIFLLTNYNQNKYSNTDIYKGIIILQGSFFFM